MKWRQGDKNMQEKENNCRNLSLENKFNLDLRKHVLIFHIDFGLNHENERTLHQTWKQIRPRS